MQNERLNIMTSTFSSIYDVREMNPENNNFFGSKQGINRHYIHKCYKILFTKFKI